MYAVESQDVLSETEDISSGEASRLVPVAESIRYRKRAQSAEKQVESLAEQLAEAKSQACEAAEELAEIRSEHELMRKLACCGALDLEAAVLMAKARMQGRCDADIDGVIEQLTREKQYLFARGRRGSAAKKTSGARDRSQGGHGALEKVARKAATTGSRADLQEYLRLRRSFL
ncbi:MAG: hypothetical protein JW720_11435 [Sedimentisphaerales bacterium]|nr:hypothetical protein [Sedimentisphaerales bacterium]